MFGTDWAIFYLFMTSNVHTFFADQPFASSSLVVSDHQSWNCYYFWTTHPFHINDPSLESYVVAVCSFMVFWQMFVSGNACICEPNIYVYIIYLLINKFVLVLFVHQLSSFSTGHTYLLQRNSLPIAIKWGVYHVQMINQIRLISHTTKSVTDLRKTFTKLSNPLSRQVISGRVSSVLSFLVHTNKNYNNNNWFWYMAV